MRADNISNVGARCVSLSPLSKGSGLITGSYDIPAATLRARRGIHQHHADQGLSLLRPAGGDLRDRAADRHGRRRARHRPRRAPPQEFGAIAERCRIATRSACSTTAARYEENMDWAMDIADWKGFAARRREAKTRGKLLGLGLANYVEFLDRRAEGAHRDHSAAGRRRRRRHRHPADRPGPRDELRAGGGRPACGAGRERQHHPRRHRHGAGRRRLAFRPLDAPRRHGVLQGGGRADRQGQSDRRASCSARRRTRSSSTTAVSRRATPTAASISSSWPRKRRSIALPRRAAGRPRGRHRQRDARSGVSRTACAICEVEIDPDTGEVDITRYASVDDVGRCINPLIVHGQTHGAHRAGRRPGDVGAVLR